MNRAVDKVGESLTVAVASGKGGTGKTSLATSLARVASAQYERVAYLDCDVEEPNGHIFLPATLERKEIIHVEVPEIDQEKCDYCGYCAQICAFNALAILPGAPLVFANLCHSCAGCWTLCPQKAIRVGKRGIGVVETGHLGHMEFWQGRLDPGVATSPPLIDALQKRGLGPGINILDAPPGTSCPVVRTVERADFVLLVTEPTPFGRHDLELAAAMVRQMGLPAGVVINRSSGDDGIIEDFCRQSGLPLLGRLPWERRVAEGYAAGLCAVEVMPRWRPLFLDWLQRIREIVAGRGGEGSAGNCGAER